MRPDENNSRDPEKLNGETSSSMECSSIAVPLPDRYRIEKTLGHGAFGVVYLATDTLLERRVSIKILRRPKVKESAASIRDDLLQEARAVARLQHPHIVTVHDVLEQDGNLALVMEYIEGESLKDLIARRGPLPWREALPLIRQICEALDFAHRAGIIHRDVKPANIFLTPDGTAKLGDFGLAFQQDRPSGNMEGLVAGTPSYMSPEQLGNHPVTARSDVFSLGCLIYELFAGQRAFGGPGFTAVIYQVLERQPPFLPEVVAGFPEALGRVVARALAKDPADRPPSALALWQDLQTAAPSPRLFSRLWNRPLFRWSLAAILLTAAAASLAIYRLASTAAERVFVTVAPFENKTGLAELDYIAAGFTAELGRQLNRHPSVVVIPFADAAIPAASAPSAQEAARRAGAGWLIGGELQRDGPLMRLDYRMVSTRGRPAFSDSLPVDTSRLPATLFGLHNNLLRELDRENELPAITRNPSAYEFYLKGIALIGAMEAGQRDAFPEAKALLERGLAIEPSVELCGGLAYLYFQAVNLGISYKPENLTWCRHYLEKGSAMDTRYAPLEDIRVRYLIQTGNIESALKISVRELASGKLDLYQLGLTAMALRHRGNHRASESLYRQSLVYFPENYYLRLNLGICLFQSGRRREGLERITACVRNHPEKYWARFYSAWLALQSGDLPVCRSILDGLPDTPPTRNLRFQLRALENGGRDFQPDEEMLQAAGIDVNFAYRLAESYSLAGRLPEALHCLKTAAALGWGGLEYEQRDPLLARLRQDPEYHRWQRSRVAEVHRFRQEQLQIIEPLREHFHPR